MKCWKCHTTMVKDEYSKTATCPCCGRSTHYRTKSEKRSSYSWSSGYSSGGSGGGGGGGDGCTGCASILGIGALIIIGLPLLLLSLIFGDGFWSFLGGTISFIFGIVWSIVEFAFEALWWIVSGIFDLIF